MDDTLELKDGQNIVIKASNQHPNKGEVVKYTIKSADKDVSEIHYSGNVWFNDRIGNIENSLSQEFQTLDDNGNLVMYVNLTSEHIKDGVYYFNELHLKRNILPDYIQLNRQDLIETDSTSKVYVGINDEEPIDRQQLQGKEFWVYTNYKKIKRGTPVKYTIKTEKDKIRDSGFLLANSSNDSFYSQFATYDSEWNRIVFIDTSNLEIGKKYNVGTLGDSIGSDIKPEDIYNVDGEFEVSNEDVRRDKPELIDSNANKFKSNKLPDNDKNILNKIDISVNGPGVTALVGPSGSGKTTIFELIERFYDFDDGTIELYGNNIYDLPIKVLRSNITFVEQNASIFSGTVLENLQIANKNVSRLDCLHALNLVNLFQDIPSEEILDRVIGESGITLSGGEKQRLSLARALISPNDIILLDETTSNLDSINESKIHQLIKDLSRRKTVLIIAHRLSTIKNADMIYVLGKGKVIESGTHEQLLSLDGSYKKMYETQIKG